MQTCVSMADVMAIRQFLLDSYRIHNGLYNWEPRRWEGLVFHRNDADRLATRARIAQTVGILREPSGFIQGVAIDEYPGGYFLQTIQGDVESQTQLVAWIVDEQMITINDTTFAEIWCGENDIALQDILLSHNFVPTSHHQIRRHQVLDSSPTPLAPLPDGYAVRSISSGDDMPSDAQRMAELLNAAFGRGFHSAEEYQNFLTLAPSCRTELEIVVTAPDGSFAAHAGFTAHEEESFVVVEPVCTHPDHQNLGLARVAMTEGLNRCRALGIRDAYIEAWYSNPVSNHVYQSMGFTEPSSEYIWRREQ